MCATASNAAQSSDERNRLFASAHLSGFIALVRLRLLIRIVEAAEIAEDLLDQREVVAVGRRDAVDHLHHAPILEAVDLHVLNDVLGIEDDSEDFLLDDLGIEERG